MLRYQVIGDPQGRYVVFPAWLVVISLRGTYGRRAEAQRVADQLNGHIRTPASARPGLDAANGGRERADDGRPDDSPPTRPAATTTWVSPSMPRAGSRKPTRRTTSSSSPCESSRPGKPRRNAASA